MSKHTIKYNRLLLFFIIAVSIIGLYFFFKKQIQIPQNLKYTKNKINYQKSSEENNQNKKYTNNDFKFSFLYPSDFYIKEIDDYTGKHVILTPLSPDSPQQPDEYIFTSFEITPIPKGKEFDELMEYYQEQSEDKEIYPDFSIKNIEIDGMKTKLIRANDPYSGNMISAFLIDIGKYVIEISYFESTSFTNEYKKIVDSIIFL